MAESTEPGSLGSLQRSIQCYLDDNNSSTNVMKDHQFNKLREVLSACKRDFVVNNAKGNRPQAARELTEDEDLLFQTGQFGEDDPEVLQHTVWRVLSMYFEFRARDECRRLQWGYIAVKDDPVSGKEAKPNEDQKQDRETTTARLLVQKPTPVIPRAVQFVFILSLPVIVLTK